MEDSQSPSQPIPPKISVIVISYNNAAGLRRCLTALEASQARAEMEIIVMDNGSQDGSGTMDADFPNVTFMRLPRNFGATKVLNIGTRTAVGDNLFFLTPEVEVSPETVSQLAAVLDANQDAMAVCPTLVDSGGNPAGDLWLLPDPATLKGTWRNPDALPHWSAPLTGDPAPVEYAGRIALMARKFFVRGLNFLDERYGDFGPDLELAFQIRRSGKKTLVVPAARAVRYPAPPLHQSAKTIILADRANGVAVFLSKHYGFMAGLLFQIGAALSALFKFQFGLFMTIASGSKIDGSQSTL
jgi:GT2 family glycosyltransferase